MSHPGRCGQPGRAWCGLWAAKSQDAEGVGQGQREQGHRPVPGVGGQWMGCQKEPPRTPTSPGGDWGARAISAGRQLVTGLAPRPSPTSACPPFSLSPPVSPSSTRPQPVTCHHPLRAQTMSRHTRPTDRTQGRWGPGLLLSPWTWPHGGMSHRVSAQIRNSTTH